MNESETRAELIDPQLKESGWGVVEDSKVLREHHITLGRIQAGGARLKPEIADYVLVYKNQKLAVIEAKSDELEATEGVTQAKAYAEKLKVEHTYATNGRKIYEISMKTGEERYVDRYPTPEELWNGVYADQNEWRLKFTQIPFEDNSGTKAPRYYQEIAVNKTMEAIAQEKTKILLTLATGTGKTFIAFQIAWKLFQSRWNLSRDGGRRPRILFLADRNILANQAFNAFSAFHEDALVRISPSDIKKKGGVPTNGNIFFTIFQTFMSGTNNTPYFGDYPADFFDLIVIDECHRGGARDESNWRGILEYFYPAVQLGLTATPKRKDNIDTYRYFGEPVYIYSLKEGVNDGFLTPFKVKRIKTTIDDYVYTPDDEVVEGDVEPGKLYVENDFNKKIEIIAREDKRVQIMLDDINQNDKTIVFCANQNHAAMVRDLINRRKKSQDPNYCVRVTANEGERGDQFLREFQDNEKTIPTILTTSQKLSTGVDARNVRNIVLMRPVNSMIEFKQIVGRGTRLFDGKDYFTIYDFVDAYLHFSDPEWDGEPIEEICKKCSQNPCVCVITPPEECPVCGQTPCVCEKTPKICPVCGQTPCVCIAPPKGKLKIKLRDGKEREIQHMMSTSFWGADGKPLSVQEFMDNMFGVLPDFFKNEEELRKIWSNPITRKVFLEQIDALGYGKDELTALQKLINAEDSDLFDVLSFVAYATKPISRNERVAEAERQIMAGLDDKQKEFIQFVLSKYIDKGVEELDEWKLPILLNLKYNAIDDAKRTLGGVDKIRSTFFNFQKFLYTDYGLGISKP
jgi:type I restriction enzyme R subunit